MVAIGRVVIGSREHMVAIRPRGKGMVGTTLLYPYEVRKENELFDRIPLEPRDLVQRIGPRRGGIAIIASMASLAKPSKCSASAMNTARCSGGPCSAGFMQLSSNSKI
jgi:hypothetical protein